MATKQSIKGAVRDAMRADRKIRGVVMPPDGTQSGPVATADSFVNFAHKLGVGADNALSSASYGYNPITRNRTLLEFIHRGSWLGGIAIDTVADDMTRAGVDFITELPPEDQERIDNKMADLAIWEQINEAIKWSRLYGGSVCVALVDGQDLRTPLNPETCGRGQFKGLLSLDRWMVEPSLEDLVTEYGPHLGLPRYYRVGPNAPALRGTAIHHSRIMFRMVGVQLPYQQRLTENLWGISVLERLYDRMIAFDSASTGAAQLVYKAFLRTLKIDGLRDMVAAGGKPMQGLHAYVEMMRRYQGLEGITMLDGDDEFEVQQHSAFSGLSDVLDQMGQQISGALQIPLVRLFGQSPAGLNSTGESDLRMYYDGIQQQQKRTMYTGMMTTYQLLARSEGVPLPGNFNLGFTSLWQMSDKEKSEIATSTGTAIDTAYQGGVIGRQTALKELRQSSKVTGIFSNITEDAINAADDEVEPPGIEGMGGLPGLPGLPGLNPLEGDDDETQGPNGPAGGLIDGTRRRVKLLGPPASGGTAGGIPGAGNGAKPPAGGPASKHAQGLRRSIAPLG